MKHEILAGAALGLILAGSVLAQTLEELVADPQRWPAEVTVVSAAKATVIKDGQPAGMMLVGAGKKIAVMNLAADGVTGKLGGATVKVPLAKTSLFAAPESAAPEAARAATAANPAPAAAGPGTMQRLLEGKLVQVAGAQVQPAKAGTLAGVKYYGLYFSASWCGPCRRFTPEFAKIYRQLKDKHPEFEVVFVSSDRSAGEMLGYMKEAAMPWPALRFEQKDPRVAKYGGPGIPCLVLVDADGKVLSHSYEGENYVGPGKVLRDAVRILEAGARTSS